MDIIPVVLFAYARPAHLARALACLRAERIPLLYVFADGAKGAGDAAAVAEVRAALRAIDWTDVRLTARESNLGLGRNVLAGVSEVAARHEAFIVWEDDLICVPGTHAWLEAALRHYANDPRVMSVTAWNHSRVTPAGVGVEPYLDGRAECWVWGAWARSWRGMEDETALRKLAAAAHRGVSGDAYGADLPAMARRERRKNIWAVRWLYHHLQHRGFCVRPPWSMVEHIGFDAQATHAVAATEWTNPPLRPAPPVPARWPQAVEHPECRTLWRGAQPKLVWSARAARLAKAATPPALRGLARRVFGWRWFVGNYATWAEARAAGGGYDDAAIVERVLAATLAVRDGRAAFERDGVTFARLEPEPGVTEALRTVVAVGGGRLRVLDFGGALGTMYWRHCAEFAAVQDLRWDIVEQPRLVTAGRAHLGGTPLRFFESIDGAVTAGAHDMLVASTSLQYLEAPQAMLDAWVARGFPWLLFNNLPLHEGSPDRIAVQRVPPEICPATYPVWFFNRERFVARFDRHYEVVREFAAEAVWPVGWRRYPSTGLLLRRKETR